MAAWRARLEDVRRNLAAVGVADALLPAIKVLPARGPLAPMIPDSEEALPMSRRAFFRRLVEEAACSLEGKERKEGHSPSPREKLVPEGRLQAIVALCRIAERHGMAAPHEALPRLMLSHCCGHGVCERVCPTGALVRRQDGNEVVVEFHAARCLACGLCLKHCPQQAVRLATSGGALVMELARQPVRRCALCDEIFYDESEECPACRTERQLKEGVAAWFEPFHRTCSQEEVKGWIS
ncbi:MAG: hypothetical protein N2441_08065 [Rhodocyclaceae bacterium]|nr:hypothetical protein [Rhodocyclaceae bacterium]